MKKIIGIVPRGIAFSENESCMGDHYRLGNNYIKRVTEAGCLPIGLAPVDNRLSQEALAMCDGFLVQGGAEFYFYHFQIIHHAITHKKRYLGICLGQQLIYVYFEFRRRVEEEGYEGDLVEAIYSYMQRQGKGFTLQRRIPDHRRPYPPRGQEDMAKHDVNIVPGTLLHRVLGRDTIRICTFHDLSTPPGQTLVPINAWHGDVVEGTEYSDHILGVQGHPEADDLLPELFAFLS
ncbi:MAG: gamma-glutamyl-gamma-aminobutyrate hydrolase family protein [Oscillospiraceae bacterium]|nr:gamma-glutamyl-gamma-aminobutyrate hydrolase family protein [Oscillospiraceae bacterium]